MAFKCPRAFGMSVQHMASAEEGESKTLRLKVKNTFLTLDDDDDDDLSQPRLRARLNSDPGLFDSRKAAGESSADLDSEVDDASTPRWYPDANTQFQPSDRQLARPRPAPLLFGGCCDDGEDTDQEEMQQRAGLHCYQYLREGPGAEERRVSSPVGDDQGRAAEFGASAKTLPPQLESGPHHRSQEFEQHREHHHQQQHRNLEQPSKTIQPQEQQPCAGGLSVSLTEAELAIAKARLAEENAKLTEQNNLLRQQYNLTQIPAGIAVADLSGQVAPLGYSQFVQLPPQQSLASANGWWVSSDSGNFTRVLCFAVPVPIAQEQVQQSCVQGQVHQACVQGEASGSTDQTAKPHLSVSSFYDVPPQPRHNSCDTSVTSGDSTCCETNYADMSSSGDPDMERRSSCDSTFEPSSGDPPHTTVLFRNIPNNYNRDMLFDLLDNEGFKCLYNFVYLPIDFSTQACLGFAFVNLIDHDAAVRFWNKFDGYTRWVIPSKKCGKVDWSHPHQGLASNIERYRNSPVMHEDVPSGYKPMLFENGVQMQFPLPTQKLRMPRIRGLARRKDAAAAEAATSGDATDSDIATASVATASASLLAQRRRFPGVRDPSKVGARGAPTRKLRAATVLAMPVAVGRC